jgi:hypothetical protein
MFEARYFAGRPWLSEIRAAGAGLIVFDGYPRAGKTTLACDVAVQLGGAVGGCCIDRRFNPLRLRSSPWGRR